MNLIKHVLVLLAAMHSIVLTVSGGSEVNSASIRLSDSAVLPGRNVVLDWRHSFSSSNHAPVYQCSIRWHFLNGPETRHVLMGPPIIQWQLKHDGNILGYYTARFDGLFPRYPHIWGCSFPVGIETFGNHFSLTRKGGEHYEVYVLMLYETDEGMWISLPGLIEDELAPAVERELTLEACASLERLGMYKDDGELSFRSFPTYEALKDYLAYMQQASSGLDVEAAVRFWPYEPRDPGRIRSVDVMELFLNGEIEWTSPQFIAADFQPLSRAGSTARSPSSPGVVSDTVLQLDFDDVLEELEDRKLREKYGEDF